MGGQDFTRNRYTHNFFEKPMNSRWVLPFISSMDPSTKRQILANDLVRRLSIIDPAELDKLAPPVISKYNRKLIYSGYPFEERIRIVEAGIGSYHQKLEAAEKGGKEFNRMGVDT